MIIDRIKQIIDYKQISTRQFCLKIGVANGFFDKVRDVGSEKVSKILKTFPEISPEWLLTGDGSMLKKQINDVTNQFIKGDNNVQAGDNSKIDARKYYSDSPDVLKSKIEEIDRLLSEKEARIKEKDAQIKEKDAQINKLLSILSNNH